LRRTLSRHALTEGVWYLNTIDCAAPEFMVIHDASITTHDPSTTTHDASITICDPSMVI